MSEFPADWVARHASLLPAHGRALDVACGRGRHARWLAARGLDVHALDRNADAIAELTRTADEQHLPIVAEVIDLEDDASQPTLAAGSYDVIVVTNYLHRPLFPVLRAALRPRGLLIYETFTRAQAARGKPTNPDFLLEPGELLRLVPPLDVLDAREGMFEDREIASVVARRS